MAGLFVVKASLEILEICQFHIHPSMLCGKIADFWRKCQCFGISIQKKKFLEKKLLRGKNQSVNDFVILYLRDIIEGIYVDIKFYV